MAQSQRRSRSRASSLHLQLQLVGTFDVKGSNEGTWEWVSQALVRELTLELEWLA